MAVLTRGSAWSSRPLAALLVVGLATFTACTDSPVTTSPVLPGPPSIPPQYRGAAYLFEVNAQKKTVKIIPPTSSTINGRVDGANSKTA